MNSPVAEEIDAHMPQQRSMINAFAPKPTGTVPSSSSADVLKTGPVTGDPERAVVKRPVEQKAPRVDILRKITAYNDIKPDAQIKAPDFLNAEHDPQKTEGLIGASTACIKVINELIHEASDTVKSRTKDTRKKLQDKINTYNLNKDMLDKLKDLDPDPETVGGKRKRSKKIGTKKKQYKRK